MTAPMHATLATFRHDLTRETEQRTGLEQMVVPSARQQPASSADRETSESFVMLTWRLGTRPSR